MKKKSVKKSAKKTTKKEIKHCYSCKEGRLIKHRDLIFCGFCGKEFRRSSL